MNTLPYHGRISCRACWPGTDALVRTFEDTSDSGMPLKFHFENNPGAWGATNPRILVLGQTKGFTQSKDIAEATTEEQYEAVAFSDCRTELHDILRSVGLAQNVECLDPLFHSKEKDWHWGSLIRCTLAAWDKSVHKKTKQPKGWSSSSGLVGRAYSAKAASVIPSNCTKRFLSVLPERLRLVILLGNSADHIKRVRTVIGGLHKNLRPHPQAPEVAYLAGGATWVHVVHPSGAARGYHRQFIDAEPGTAQGRKALEARQAITIALGNTL